MMNSEQPDYYRILGVSPQDSQATIRAAYKQARKAAQTGGTTEQQLLQTAYEVLSDPDRRAVYNDLLQEAQQPSLEISLDLSRDTLSVSDQEQLIYMLVEVASDQQKDNQQGQRPLNLCFVVDRSTSMRGERLLRVKEAANLLFAKLTPEDVVSLISFSDRADVVIAATNNSNLRLLQNRVNTINPSGGTEIYQGLSAAEQQLSSVNLARYNNHLILLTDGHTYGDENQCLELAQQMAKKGIGISAFGIGTEWNDQFLDNLVAPSGGCSDFIETPEQVLQHLQERIQGLGTVHARNMRLLSHFSQMATISYGLKIAPYTQPLDLSTDEIKLGNLEGRSPLSFLLEVRIAPQPRESRVRLPLELVADMGRTDVDDQEKSYKTDAQCLVLAEVPAQETPSPYLTKAVRIMTLYRMNEKAWADAQAGNMDQATRRMNHLTTRLLEAGETRLARQTQMEASRLAHIGTMSLEGRKTIKYGTRALINEALKLEENE
ncbi:MAG: VWA domain-containing protein [Chloroflexota bacterium]|jgi:Ca-activated chloride channel homolog